MKYRVDITETYKRTVEIEADNLEEVYDHVNDMVDNGEIDLPCDGGDYDYSVELFAKRSEV